MLEEVALRDSASEFGVAEEPVLTAVFLAAPAQPRSRRNRDLELGHTVEQGVDQRAFTGARGPGDDEDGLTG